jgi:hypothetical protein
MLARVLVYKNGAHEGQQTRRILPASRLKDDQSDMRRSSREGSSLKQLHSSCTTAFSASNFQIGVARAFADIFKRTAGVDSQRHPTVAAIEGIARWYQRAKNAPGVERAFS